MHVSKIFFIVLVLLFSIGFSQEKKVEFKAFGYSPDAIHPSLYEKLNAATSIGERNKYLDTIAEIFLRSGNADSLLHYSEELKRSKLYARPNDANLKNYELKALYYEGVGAQKMGLLDDATAALISGVNSMAADHAYYNTFNLELAETYLLKRQLDKAKQLLDEFLFINKEHQLYLKYVLVKSHFYILNKDYDLAISLIEDGFSVALNDKHDKMRLLLELKLAIIKINRGNLTEAITSCESIKQTALEKGFYDVFTEAALNEGLAYFLQKEYTIAEIALSSTYVNTLQWNRLELQQKVIKALVKVYNAKEDYKNAYSLMTQYQNVTRQIADEQNQRLVRDLELKYETLKKEKEIDELQEDQLLKAAEIDRQKTIKYAFLIGFLIILIPVVLLLVVYYQKLQTQSLLNEQRDAMNQQELKSLMQTQELTLAKNTISVQRNERDRIARELHDSIGGNLAGIKLKMNSLGDSHPDFKTILSQLDATYEQVREISHSLIPKAFEDSSFTELVNNYIQNLNLDDSINLRFKAHPNDVINKLNPNLQVALFNIIKELVTNAFKHANASEIEIQLTSLSEEKSIELLYEDDGVGFDLKATKKGIGLNNLETRVKGLNGTFSINTSLNRGTVISISIPQL